MLKNRAGFTLMEILVVVTIIGILAAIAVPSYIYAVEKGRKDACIANKQILQTQVERYRLENEKLVLDEGEELVTFLKGMGYLSGQDIECPFEGEYRIENYELEGPGDVIIQTVICGHCDGDDNGEN